MSLGEVKAGLYYFFSTYRWHVIAWAVYIFYEVFIVKLFSNGMRFFVSNYVVYYLLNISLFYVNAHYVLDGIFYKGKQMIWRLPLMLLIELFVYASVLIVEGVVSGSIELDTSTSGFVFELSGFQYFVIPCIPYLLYSTGYFFLLKHLRFLDQTRQNERIHFDKEMENQQLKNDLLQIEKGLLRAQINPHLIYNTLSFITYSATRNPEEANIATQLLASIMRYSLERNNDSGLIFLTEEIEQIKNIIQLNQLRFNHQLYFNLHVADDVEGIKTVQLVLLTVVENMFKHGQVKNRTFPARVTIEVKDNFLTFSAFNLISHNQNIMNTSGKGLSYVEKTMSIYFPNRHKISYGYANDIFSVEISFPVLRDS